jgi:hypothetical protein
MDLPVLVQAQAFGRTRFLPRLVATPSVRFVEEDLGVPLLSGLQGL